MSVQDDIFNPFHKGVDEFHFLNVLDKKSSEPEEVREDLFENTGKTIKSAFVPFEIIFELGTHIDINQRIRYSVWDLLGDVGGFNDGLFLVCSIFMSSYSAFAYSVDLLSQFPVNVAHATTTSRKN